MLVKLPNGLLDGVDLFNVVNIDELRGKQQNYLIDKELVIGNIGHVPKILEDMVLSFQTESGRPWKGNKAEAIWKLPSGDLETILIKIREKTYGPRYFHEATCTHCGKEHKNLELKLDELELTPMSMEEMLKPKVFLLPKANVEVELKPVYLEDLMKSAEILKDKQDKLLTSFLQVSIKRIGTKTDITEEDVANLYSTDIDFIKEQAEKVKLEGFIDTDVTINCVAKGKKKGCGKDFTVKLNCFDPGFFVHTRG
jgi:hypothetical protein